MRGFLPALAAFAVLFGAGEAAGAQPTKHRPAGASNPVVQMEAGSKTVSGRNTTSDRAISTSRTFRAEDIVPDICKGCSS